MNIDKQDLERCEDAWLAEVQEELRHGRLTLDNFSFLHGEDTCVPGSWVAGQAACGRQRCQQLAIPRAEAGGAEKPSRKRTAKEAKVMSHIQREECETCRQERASKARVAQSVGDARFRQTKFVGAPAIYPNNDVKYSTNKIRAQQFAAHHGIPLAYVTAKDTPSAAVLSEKPDLVRDKRQWLQRHDRECGDLYGVLPLAVGMPMALTDHIDRNPAKQLLRGKICYVHS